MTKHYKYILIPLAVIALALPPKALAQDLCHQALVEASSLIDAQFTAIELQATEIALKNKTIEKLKKKNDRLDLILGLALGVAAASTLGLTLHLTL